MAVPSQQRYSSLRRFLAVQLGYAVLFSVFVLWPMISQQISGLGLVCLVLVALWFLGILGSKAKWPRSGELLLCGSTAPVLVGMTQLVYRLNFVWKYSGLTLPDGRGSAGAFATVWAFEILLVLLPGLLFFWGNARSLAPIQPEVLPSTRRPSDRSSRK